LSNKFHIPTNASRFALGQELATKIELIEIFNQFIKKITQQHRVNSELKNFNFFPEFLLLYNKTTSFIFSQASQVTSFDRSSSPGTTGWIKNTGRRKNLRNVKQSKVVCVQW